MTANTQQRILFGLKVKQFRQARNLSFADLAGLTGMSVSYLNEIEKGKKFPKESKVALLANALQIPAPELLSTDLGEGLAPVAELLRTNFLNELPLDLYGIELSKVVELIAGAPARVGAFISTLLELSRDYAVKEEHFYFSALRAYIELHNSYFEDLEQEVLRFGQRYELPAARPLAPDYLKDLLEKAFGYRVQDHGLDPYPELQPLRSVFLPKHRELLLNSKLNAIQRSFQFGKELGFQFLGIRERALTSSLQNGRSFEEVLNHSKAIYFSVALHIPQPLLLAEMEAFFNRERWDAQAFLDIMYRFDATPEMLFHRLTNVLPRFFGMRKLFFLRFVHDLTSGSFRVDKELHLGIRRPPHAHRLNEHYCSRWVSLSALRELEGLGHDGGPIATAQVSHPLNTDDAYLCIAIARADYPLPDKNVSVTIGLHLSPELRQRVRFLQDPAIPHRQVHTTCERCPVTDCAERSAPPLLVESRLKAQRIQNRLEELMQ
jgi:transcriptional regulator with XRE-family HTH domain